MKKLLLAMAALAALMSAAPAGAADLRSWTPDTDDVAAPNYPFLWTGFYVGGQAGIGDASHELDLSAYQNGGQPGQFGILNLDGLSGTGAIGGGQIGYDQQIGRIVIGAFGSYNFTSIKSEIGVLPDVGGPVIGLEKGDEWSIGGRAGVLVNPKTLVYGLVAYSEADYKLTGVPAGVGPAIGLSEDKTLKGVTAGGGVEFALTSNVFLGMEYTHFFADSAKWLDTCEAAGAPAGCNSGLKLSDELSEDRIMGAVKLKLNPLPAFLN